jgi:hypothetical protein
MLCTTYVYNWVEDKPEFEILDVPLYLPAPNDDI